MRIHVLILIFLICFTSCKSSKRAAINTKKEVLVETSVNKLVETVIENAEDYNGVRYKFGGTTRKGMDCSGLIYVSFKKENILLPRISRDMAKKGQLVQLRQVEKGDLLFFKTGKSKKEINHVGLVTRSNKGRIEFIHATTSRGVITSSLKENYWNDAFVEARRIL
jgi:cell wall-associated NlpC family hydrolase